MREQCSHCPPSRHLLCCSGAAVPAGAVGLVGWGEDFSLWAEDGLLGSVLNPYFCLILSLSVVLYIPQSFSLPSGKEELMSVG